MQSYSYNYYFLACILLALISYINFPSPLLVPLCRRASRTNITQDSSVFICISMLARAVGPQVEKDIKALLDQMFSVGLSLELTSALRVIAQEVPQLQRDIQGK